VSLDKILDNPASLIAGGVPELRVSISVHAYECSRFLDQDLVVSLDVFHCRHTIFEI